MVLRPSLLSALAIALLLERPFHWRSGVQEGVNLVLFTVETDEGMTGYGESICSEKCGTTRQRPLRQRSPKIASMAPGERPTNARAISRPYDTTAAGSSQIDSP